jgi:hypothetical protein
MKERYIKPASATFEFATEGSGVSLTGDKPTPADDDVELGEDVSLALEESLATRTRDSYRIGFIAEHSEPFWVFDTYRSGSATNAFNVRLADIPQSANRHLEIVLFDRNTNRVIPHADVKLHLRSTSSRTQARTRLPFLLAAFYHYGNSLYLPDDTYKIQATIESPDIHTLNRDRFPGETSVNFTWSATSDEQETSGEHDH